MKTVKSILFGLLIGAFSVLLQQCTIIRPAEVGVVMKYGKMKDDVWEPGMHPHSIIGIQVVEFSTRMSDYSAKLNLPTKEGLEVNADITLLYHINVDSVQSLFLTFGTDYHTFVKNNCNASSREVFAQYLVKDIIVAREEIELKIYDKVHEKTMKYGLIIDQVLLRDIILPVEYENAIKNKVTSEQLAMQTKFDIDKQRMEVQFNIEKQKLEADWAIEQEKKEAVRLQIEANALKKYQDTISATMTDTYLRYKSLEITRGLVTSPNTKVVITDGKSPVILSDK